VLYQNQVKKNKQGST